MVDENLIFLKVLDNSRKKGISPAVIIEIENLGYNAFKGKYITGEWKMSPPTLVRIPKDGFDGVDLSNPKSYRELIVCQPRDRILLAYVNALWNEMYGSLLSKSAYAYQEGKTIQMAVKTITDKTDDALKLDMHKFFESVSMQVVNQALAELSVGLLDTVVKDFYNNDEIIIDGELCHRTKSLGQGLATSAFLSNYVMRHIDSLMYLNSSHYIRYSDDMLIFGTKPQLLNAMNILEAALLNLGLNLNPDKTRYLGLGDSAKFLGYKITHNTDGYSINIADDKVDIFKRELRHNLTEKKIVKHMGVSTTKIVRDEEKLKSAISYANYLVRETLNFSYTSQYADKIQQWSIITEYGTLEELNHFIVDRIRSSVTGSQNITHNLRVIPNELLDECGYVSLREMVNAARTSKAVYKSIGKPWFTLKEPKVSVSECVVPKNVETARKLYTYLYIKIKNQENKVRVDLIYKKIYLGDKVIFDATKPCNFLENLDLETEEYFGNDLLDLQSALSCYAVTGYVGKGGSKFLLNPYIPTKGEDFRFVPVFNAIRCMVELSLYVNIVCQLKQVTEWSGPRNNYAWIDDQRKFVLWKSWF